MEQNTLEQLKARAYDLISIRESATIELQKVNERIAEIIRQQIAETKEKKAEQPSSPEEK